ncbi:MAG: YkgJ family cysteine cluster protein [Planctomycetota bacterium]|jgi:Fe-S-cluster containining protein
MCADEKNCWYAGGLHFGCKQCGNCCSGPNEGYIWITRPEVERLADYLKITVGVEGQRRCIIYPVRPNQCRTWPFWSENLSKPEVWNRAGVKCGGINQGRSYKYEEIEAIRKQRKWWSDAK